MSPLSWLAILPLAGFAGWFGWEKSRRRSHPVPHGLQEGISIPHQAEFELYHNALSLCSMKTRLCLSELGIPYESHHIDLIETGFYENIRSRFLAVNPAGTVPVLVHQGHPVYESHEQIRYAARFAPEGRPSLVPADEAERATMEEWIDRSSLTDDPLENGHLSAGNAIPGLTTPLFITMVEKIAAWKILEGLFFHFDKRRPAAFLSFKLLGIERLEKMGPAPKMIARSREQMHTHLDGLESQLEASGGPWILGETYTLADVSWLVIFERLRQADFESVFLGPQHPACAAYWERLRTRDAYREAILEQSHPLIEYGQRRIQESKAAHPAVRTVLEGE